LIFSHSKSGSFLPKCPKPAVFLKIGLFNFKSLEIQPGLKSKFLLTILYKSFSVKSEFTVPYVLIHSDRGSANPIPYEI